MSPLQGLPRPTALVTGASSGIGEVFARKLAARGYDLILVARREARLREIASQLRVRTQVLAIDLAGDEGLRAAENAIVEAPRLQLLINNAGFGTRGRFWETDLAGQDRMHRLHVIATMRLTHAALREMVPKRDGSIINVSSVAAFGQSVGNVSYCATKSWINSFTEGLALELRNVNSPVRVQALCPGFTVTEFLDSMGVSRDEIPSFLWLDADFVVDTSLRELARGKVIVIPSWKYKFAATMMRITPPFLQQRFRPKRNNDI